MPPAQLCNSWVGSISSILACLICTQARTVLGPCSEQFLGFCSDFSNAPRPTCLPKLLQVFLPRQQATNIGGGCLALQSPESLRQALKKRRANALPRSQVLCPVLRAGLRYLGHWGVRKTGVNSLVSDRTVLREKRVRAPNNSQILFFGGFSSSSDYYWSRLGIFD